MNQNKLIKSVSIFFKNHWRIWTILMFVVIIMYLGIVFYKYIYTPIYSPQEIMPPRLEIKESIYNALINKFSQQENNINEILNKNYFDPFK